MIFTTYQQGCQRGHAADQRGTSFWPLKALNKNIPLKYNSPVKSKIITAMGNASFKRNDSKCRTAKQKRSTSQWNRRDVTETNGKTRNHNQSTGNPKQNVLASTHALEFHILIHDFYSLSDELISYAADSFFKFTDANGLVFEKQHTS